MKVSCMLIVFALIGQFVNAQEFIALWGDDKIGAKLTLEDPESNTRDEVTRLSNVSNPRMQVFKPSAALDNGHAVVICPGGGYNILAIDKEGWEVATWLNTLGYTAYVLEYRVPKQREGALQDAQRAMRIVRHKTGKNAKVGVLGFSAGGHLAASVSTRFTENHYEDIDDVDAASARPDFSVLIYPAYLDKGPNESLSPDITLSNETPPMFIFMTADDPYAGSSIAMAGALRKNKTSVEFHLLPEGGHGYGLRAGIEAAETWPVLLEKWLINDNKR